MTAKEQLIFARNRWEIARTETNSETGILQWIRRDSSYICNVGDEIARMKMPAKPAARRD
jgi:hypothetical protein